MDQLRQALNNSAIIVWVLIAILIMLLISKYIVGWYHEIGKRNKYMEQQTKLLEQILNKLK